MHKPDSFIYTSVGIMTLAQVMTMINDQQCVCVYISIGYSGYIAKERLNTPAVSHFSELSNTFPLFQCSNPSGLQLGLVKLTFFLFFFLVTFHSLKRTPSRSLAKVGFHSSLVLGMNSQEAWTLEGFMLRTVEVVDKHAKTWLVYQTLLINEHLKKQVIKLENL